MATDEQINNFIGIADPVDVDMFSPLPSDMDMLNDVWTQGRIDSAGKSMRTAMGISQVVPPNTFSPGTTSKLHACKGRSKITVVNICKNLFIVIPSVKFYFLRK